MNLKDKAKQIRDLIVTVAYAHGSSHVGSMLSCVELMVYIYYERLRPGDIFILSKGHAALTQYCILYDLGLITREQLDNYPKRLGVHPEYSPKKGIYASTGSLGHGLPIAIGYALADRGRDVYVLLGDGELDEGSVYEGLRLKEQLELKNLYIIVDRNGFKGYDGVKRRSGIYSGHDFKEIEERFKMASHYPLLEFATVKGKGLNRFENQLGGHYWNITKEDIDEYQKGVL